MLARTPLAAVLDRLEVFYGPQQPTWPTDPYEFLVWWYCGYPASDDRCAKGWAGLTSAVRNDPEAILRTPAAKLAAALKPGGMVPELRAERLKEITMRVRDQYGGNLRAALTGPLSQARKALKTFPSIADPGADRILLFAGIAPLAAVPSNCPHVLVRILYGLERESYVVNYRDAQRAIVEEVPETFEARQRAFLLVKRHGQEICKTKNPKCGECAVRKTCAYFAGHTRGTTKSAVPGTWR